MTDSSMLSLSVKHRTSKPFIKDPCLGSSEIVWGQLLQMCENNKRRSNIFIFFEAGFLYNAQMPFWNCGQTMAK
jgi:hypothetical protein